MDNTDKSIENNAEAEQPQVESRMDRPFLRKVLRKKKQCAFCVDRITKIDYKEGLRLRRYISERAKILPRRATGMCAYHQRVLAKAIKKARLLAIIPYTNNLKH